MSSDTDEAGPDRRPVIAALTGIRAFAAAAVVLYHLREPAFSLLPALRAADTWLIVGFLGVDVFFVLSGFIISYNYAERFATGVRHGYASYLQARFARIYPVHLFTLLIVAAAVVFFGPAAAGAERDLTPATFLGNLLLLQALPGVEPWNGASWSISTEAAAYLLFPLFAGALLSLRRRTAIALLVAVSAVFVVGAVWLGMVMSDPTPALFWARIAGGFTLGCLLWAVWRHHPRPSRLWDVVAIAALVAVITLLAVPAVRLVYWVVVPLLALVVVATASAAGPVRAVLAARPVEWGGRISYCLYLVHMPALAVMFAVLPASALTDAPLVVRIGVLGVYLGGCVAAAAATYYLVEEPARTRLRPRAGAQRADRPFFTSSSTQR